MPTMDAVPERRATGPALAIAAAVFGWGLYLAVGAATHESHDVRKSVVILSCSLVFLVFWFAFLFKGPRHRANQTGGGWSPASVAGLLASLLTNALAVMAFAAPESWSQLARGRCLLLALLSGFVACVLSAIGLSRPTASRGKQWGLAALALVLVALIITIVGLRLSATE